MLEITSLNRTPTFIIEPEDKKSDERGLFKFYNNV